MSRPRRHSPGGMVFHVLNRGVGRRVLFTKDEDFLAFERVVEETLRTRRMGVRLLFDAQPLAFRRLARAGWRSSRVHAASDQHACETVEGASSRDRVRPSLSRALQVFSRWKQNTTSTRLFATWSGTPCVQTSWSERNRGVGRVCAVWSAKTRPFPSSRRGLCHAAWLQIVNQPQTEAEVAALRCCVNRGRPFGDP